MTQLLIVAFVVAAATAYSAWILMPAGAAALARRAARAGVARDRTLALQSRLERAGGCSDCGSCRGCASSPAAPAAAQLLSRAQERSTGP